MKKNPIKEIIQSTNKEQKTEISYLAAGKYSLLITGKDFKELKTQNNQILQEIETQAKKQNCEFELEKDKH